MNDYSSYARQRFCKVCYDVIDTIDELTELITEYDEGLQIIRNTSWFHEELPKLRSKIDRILQEWDSSDDDDVSMIIE